LAVGDLLGSSLMNLLILALLDLSHHSRGRMLSKQAAAHALSGSLSAALMCVVALGLLTGRLLERYSMLGVSAATYALGVSYLFGLRLVFLDQRIARQKAAELGLHESHPVPSMTFRGAIAGFVASAGAILLAGPFLAQASKPDGRSDTASRQLGVMAFVFTVTMPWMNVLDSIRKSWSFRPGAVFSSVPRLPQGYRADACMRRQSRPLQLEFGNGYCVRRISAVDS
jgi:hypothetical protein